MERNKIDYQSELNTKHSRRIGKKNIRNNRRPTDGYCGTPEKHDWKLDNIEIINEGKYSKHGIDTNDDISEESWNKFGLGRIKKKMNPKQNICLNQKRRNKGRDKSSRI